MILNKKITELVDDTLDKMEASKGILWDDGAIEKIKRSFPRNAITGSPYGWWNAMRLSLCGESKSNLFATYKQVQQKNGHVKKGCHGHHVTFFSMYNKEKKRIAEKGDNKEDLIPLWRLYTVFRIEDTTLPAPVERVVSKSADWNATYMEIEKFLKSYMASDDITFEQAEENDIAYYSPSERKIHISKKEIYHSAMRWYATCFHECTHSTKEALNRKLERDAEEVVAELGCALLCAYFGIRRDDEALNEAVYIKSWGRKLREHKDWLFYGAARAQKAVNYMLKKTGLPTFEEKFSEHVG